MDHILLPRTPDGCVTCPDLTPPCDCPDDQQCFQITQNCTTCSYYQCVALDNGDSGSGGGGGLSKGAVAGAVIGVLIFFAICLGGGFWWYRRRAQSNESNEKGVKDVPAKAEDVLQRADPNEKPPSVYEQGTVRVYSTCSDTTINLDPESRGSSRQSSGIPRNYVRASVQSNPFEDSHSIQTTSTGSQSTNVIPIALVSPTTPSPVRTSMGSHGPQRPVRTPDVDLNLDHVNVSGESMPSPGYTRSTRSGSSGVRNSYMSNASYASDFMNEAPTIVMSKQAPVRQVFGAVKAEMVQVPSTPMSTNTAATGSEGSKVQYLSISSARPSARSPLATSSFGPADVVKEAEPEVEREAEHNADTGRADPFGDHNSLKANPSPSASVTTFGTPSRPTRDSRSDLSDLGGEPSQPWNSSDNSRPSSVGTQASGLIYDIGNATRVRIGMEDASPSFVEPSLPSSVHVTTPAKPLNRMTSGRLVTPATNDHATAETLEEQQRRAYIQAQQARAQGTDANKRVSGVSVVSRASTRADSILESFPFVPPSPISDRPVRTPATGRSPLAEQTIVAEDVASEAPADEHSMPERDGSPLPAPPNRRLLGMSTASQTSVNSTGLGSFHFEIGTSSDTTSNECPTTAPPTSFSVDGRQRASLDTLALTSDLSSYPLEFDRESFPAPPRQ